MGLEFKLPSDYFANEVTDARAAPGTPPDIERPTDVPADGTQSPDRLYHDSTEEPQYLDTTAPKDRRPPETVASHSGTTATGAEVTVDGLGDNDGTTHTETGHTTDGDERPTADIFKDRPEPEQHQMEAPLTRSEWLAEQKGFYESLGIPEGEWPEELREALAAAVVATAATAAAELQNGAGAGKPAAATETAEGQPDTVRTETAEAEVPKATADEKPAEVPAAAEQPETPEPAAPETPTTEPAAAEAVAEAPPTEEPAPAADTGDGNNLNPPDNTPPSDISKFGAAGTVEQPTELRPETETETDVHDTSTNLVGDGREGQDDTPDDNDEFDEPPELGSMMRQTQQPDAGVVQNLDQPDPGRQDQGRGVVAPGDRPNTSQPAPAYAPPEWPTAIDRDSRTEVDAPTGSGTVGQASEDHPVAPSSTLDDVVVTTAAMATERATGQALREATDTAPVPPNIQVPVFDSAQPAGITDPDRPAAGQTPNTTHDVSSLGGDPAGDIERIGAEQRDLPELRMDPATGRITTVGPTGGAAVATGGIEASDASREDAAGDAASGDGDGSSAE